MIGRTYSSDEPIVEENAGVYEQVDINSAETSVVPMTSAQTVAMCRSLSTSTPELCDDSVSTNNPSPKQMKYRLHHDYVSPAFTWIRVLEPKQKKTERKVT